jgi:hypothetical protein
LIHNIDCFCAQLSRDAREEIFGTASTVDVWLLLEYSGRWAVEAFRESDLPPAVKARLSECLRLLPRSRLLLIRQRERRTSGLAFYIARSREQNSVLYEFKLDRYEDLLDLDVPGLLLETADHSGHISSRPLFLVCTHGIHDKCCAKYGRPVYTAIAQREDSVVWQSSHVGGDRFAANVVCLPHGIYYGRVDQNGSADAIVEAFNRGEVYIESYRGRSCYGFVVQAAEYFIRQRTGNLRIEGLELLGSRRAEPSRWVVTFFSTGGRLEHRVQISRERMGVQNYLVCKAEEQSELYRYQLDAYEALKTA